MRAAVVVVVALVAVACSSKEEDLFSLRAANRGALDDLYSSYGGGALAGELKKETDRGVDEVRKQPAQPGDGAAAAVEFLKVLGNAATEVDRVMFDDQCLALGRGQHAVIFNDKGKAFFARGDVAKACTSIAIRAVKINALEKAIGLAPLPQG